MTTRQDFLQAVRKASFPTPDSLPLRAKRGEERFGVRGGDAKSALIDSTMTRTVYTGTLGDAAVEAEAIFFRDYPVVRLDTALCAQKDLTFDSVAVFCREFCGADPVITGPAGQTVACGEETEEGGRCVIAFDDASVLIDSSLPVRFRREGCGVSVRLRLKDVTLQAGETLPLPRVTVCVAAGGRARVEALYEAFLETHVLPAADEAE